ncbi:MAG: hypothetical protein JNL43_02340 [Flavobacteriales bacterium]|nr:hypothetical protein [Flavobacteriales bacterium]
MERNILRSDHHGQWTWKKHQRTFRSSFFDLAVAHLVRGPEIVPKFHRLARRCSASLFPAVQRDYYDRGQRPITDA